MLKNLLDNFRMRKIIFTFLVLFMTSGFCFAETFDTDLFLFCHNTGEDKYKYEVLMKQALVVNALQLEKDQRKQLEVVFNKYSSDYAVLAKSLEDNKTIYNQMKKDKTSLKVKSNQKKKISGLRKEIKKVKRTMDKDTKKILNHKQRSKYNSLKKSIL